MAEVKEEKKAQEKESTSDSSFAVIKTGGKQYLVEAGKVYDFEKLDTEEGKDAVFEEVLLVSNGKELKLGAPILTGAKVTGTVVSQFKDDKVVVLKYKPKKRYRKTQGHRQNKTKVKITKIA